MSLPKALKTKDRILQISLQLLMSVANGLSQPIILLQSWGLVLETCIITFETSMKSLRN